MASPFGFRTQAGATQAELAGGVTFDGAKHQRAFQRAAWKALQEIKEARPKLAGQPAHLFDALADAVKGLQQAAFYREDAGASNAPDRLLYAIRNLINAPPVLFDIQPLITGNAYTRGQVLTAEKGKSLGLLGIEYAEVRLSVVNPWSRAINDFSLEAVEKTPDLTKLRDCIDRMHRAAVEMFLEHFGADLPEEVDEIEEAKARAAALTGKMAEVAA